VVLPVRGAHAGRTPPWLVVGAAVGLFLTAWGLVHLSFWSHGSIVDWPTYQRYGDAIKDGGVPYRDFPVEYPPGALPAFVLPSLIGGSYASTFDWLMAGCGGCLVALLALVRPWAAFFVAVSPLLVGALIDSRFDLWPTLLATAGVVLLARDRHNWGWGFVGAAAATKLWPIVFVPVALVWSLRRGARLAPLVGAVVFVAIVLPFFVVSPGGVWSSAQGQLSRPLQVESLGAAFLEVYDSPHIVDSHGSQNIAGHHVLTAGIGVVQVAILLALWAAFATGRLTAARFTQYTAASVCAFVAFGKVLSPQFLIWLVPLVPLVRGRRGLAAVGVLTTALVLTQTWFPRGYFAYVERSQHRGEVLLRDVLLVALVAVLALPSLEDA
jgi:uncharacterized membrane protein